MDLQLNSMTFFDADAVKNRIPPAKRKVLSKFGAFVRTTAQRSLKRPKRQTLKAMDAKERQIFEIRKREAEAAGKPKPKRRVVRSEPSKPGEPPQLQQDNSPLKKLLFFGYDFNAGSVVVGPAPFKNLMGAEDLEKGHGMEPRPFMKPSLDKNLPQLPEMWRDAITA